MAKKAMTLNPTTLDKIATAVCSEIKTSLDLPEILSLLADIASYEIGETSGFPFNDHVKMNGHVGNASVVVPVDLKQNVILLHEFYSKIRSIRHLLRWISAVSALHLTQESVIMENREPIRNRNRFLLAYVLCRAVHSTFAWNGDRNAVQC